MSRGTGKFFAKNRAGEAAPADGEKARRRKTGWFAAAWILMAAGLYFFENNTGTRVILICSLVLTWVFRKALFGRPSGEEEGKREPVPPPRGTAQSVIPAEDEEPGDLRPYRPGDPVRRIHWKMSAKRKIILVRQMEPVAGTDGVSGREPVAGTDGVSGREPAAGTDGAVSRERAERKEETGIPERFSSDSPEMGGRKSRRDFRRTAVRSLWILLLAAAALLLALPAARGGFLQLCNRVFARSEAVNAYAYRYFPVPENPNTFLAAALLGAILLAAGGLAALSRSGLPALGLTAALTAFQVYFGLAFPAWINLPVYGLLAWLLLRRRFSPAEMKRGAALALAVTAVCFLLIPGQDAATEAVSERVRDYLSGALQPPDGVLRELPEGEREVRRAHTQSLVTGAREAAAAREFRPVSLEEEQISLPGWIDYLRIILLLLLAAALLILPFLPFLAINARRRKAEEARKAFQSENVGEAVAAIFQRVILWLEETGNGAGNRLYREWGTALPGGMPEGYGERFHVCAADFEEAAYSGHDLPEEKRGRALALLRETEEALWQRADRKQRFRLKYWMGLRE